MTIRIATWNINSVRLREAQVLKFLQDYEIDILCLQETKCPEGQFPSRGMAEAGYRYIAERGQSGYHGVAIVSRLPFTDMYSRDFCKMGDARHVSVRLEGSYPLSVHSFYVPAGGDEPDPKINEKFDHKLSFLNEMNSWLNKSSVSEMAPIVITGDLNIAPHENDVWSHKKLQKVVSHTQIERDLLNKIQANGGWIDAVRKHVPHDEKLYSWWSYRARDWSTADKGRRLDHIWLDKTTAESCINAEVIRDVRGWERPSDHAPIITTLGLSCT